MLSIGVTPQPDCVDSNCLSAVAAALADIAVAFPVKTGAAADNVP